MQRVHVQGLPCCHATQPWPPWQSPQLASRRQAVRRVVTGLVAVVVVRLVAIVRLGRRSELGPDRQENPDAERLRAVPSAGHGADGSSEGSASSSDRSTVSGDASSLWCTCTRVALSLAEQVNRSTRGCARKIR